MGQDVRRADRKLWPANTAAVPATLAALGFLIMRRTPNGGRERE